ncbi:sugar 3,4-ketoisomerase [Seleniivibrio woodruffii]|uniref:dTDP-4-dehydrorhamnose 3,5-epimerase-like enzyme n=1 Tax=Seleniivibrio woodruffii TaxID=1078050 RepID=A0A4V2PSB9_9BACT|nr:FdtA/QdtA family cupin domain-containing protein [Seleniivibrio woodruffii]TCK62141.1 dTDP-4-dehydrorhamnose 3,5-epimerase-like enzyme [Seleniivibrio woodruffii]TVZ34742.1 dTDP-4-dehydrorhamnose 3,5-epimerase-like enzyme [Seleniivibrio woodruffii]
MTEPIRTFKILGDERGSLVALETGKEIPFDIKRVYYIFDTQQGVARGFHAHKELQQILVSVSGSCKVSLDNGKGSREVYELNSPDKGLYIGPGSWREMFDFSPDCVLMVIASMLYEEDDYIRDYSRFVEYVNNGKDSI